MISTKLRDLEQMVTDRTFWFQAELKARDEYSIAKTAIKNLEAELQNAKYGFEFDIRTEKDEDGKPKYGNEKLREAAINTRMSQDKTCQQVQKEINDWQQRLNAAYRSLKQAEREVTFCLADQDTSTAVLVANTSKIGRELLDVGQSVG